MKANFLSKIELKNINFGYIGKNVLINEYVNITQLENVFINDNVRIDAFTNLISGGKLFISNNVHISSFCHLASAGEIFIDDFSGLSQGVKVYTILDDYLGYEPTNPTIPPKYKNDNRKKKTVIGKYVAIGSNSIVMPGVTIGDGVAVGALSYVSKNLEPWYVYDGKPARKIYKRNKTMLKKYKKYLAEQCL